MAVNINIPSQVKTYANLAAFPASGSLKTIYIAEDTNKTYRWDGSTYVEISASAATGLTVGTTPISSGTIGRVLFQGTGNVLQQSSSLAYDDTTKAFTLSANQNAITSLNVSNTTNGTASQSRINLTSNNGSFILGKNSTTTNTYKTLLSSDAIVYNATSGDISILNDLASGRIKFATGGVSTPQMTIFSTGNIGINTTTDAGFRLDVNGTARVQGNVTFGSTSTTGTATIQGSNIVELILSDTLNGRSVRLYKNAGSGYIIENNSGNQMSYGYASNYWMSWRNSTKSIAIASTGSEPTPDATSIFDLQSTTKGFLPPRMTTTQRNAIASPAAGLIVYDTTLNLPHFFNGTIWVSL